MAFDWLSQLQELARPQIVRFGEGRVQASTVTSKGAQVMVRDDFEIMRCAVMHMGVAADGSGNIIQIC